ncbi:hypothetical protein IKI14_05820 [bacterium]|nr:hypothetical protein [bacterium]
MQNEELKQKIENLKLLTETVDFQIKGQKLEEFDNIIGELNQSVDDLKILIETVKSQLLIQ